MIESIVHQKYQKYSIEITFFYVYGVSTCKRKCVSLFLKFGNLALEKVLGILLKEFVRRLC